MAKQQREDTLEGFTFDDGDEVFSNFKGGEDIVIATPQVKPTKIATNNPLPDFIDDDTPPVNIDKVKPEKQDKATSTTPKPSKKVEVAEEDEGEEEIPDSLFSFDEGVTEPPKPKPKEAPKDKPKSKKEAKEEEEEANEDEAQEEGQEDEDEDSLIDKDPKYFTNLALDLRDRGTLREVEIDENAEITEDEFFDLQEREFEARMEGAFEQFSEDMDNDGKDFIRAKKKGMSTKDFFSRYLAPTFDLTEFDPSNKTHINKTISHYLTVVEGLEGEELEDRKEWLKNSGKEATHAQNFYNKISKIDTARKQNIMAALDQRAKAQEEAVQEFNEALAEVLNKTETVGVFTINKSARKDIYEAITKPTIKAKKGSYVPKLVAKISKILSGSTEKDLKDLIALTMIVESDFNLPSLQEEVETQVTKRAKARIGKKQPRASSGGTKRELADFFG